MTEAAPRARLKSFEWVTFSLIAGCYGGWALALFWLWDTLPVVAFLIAVFTVALHSSLTHEVLHGHPFRSAFWNEMMVRLPLTLTVPYCRYRDLHLAHHRDANLTDPYDDPETNYLDPVVWARLTRWQRAILSFNNTLLGRILIGPAISNVLFIRGEFRLIAAGDRKVARAWMYHALGLAVLLPIVVLAPMPLWAYVAAAYMAQGVLRIRTFLEHQAHEKVRGRSVIIEDRGPLAFLFLNNNLHAVHHMHPGVPWYRLPALYRARRERFLTINQGYAYRSYGEVFRRYLFSAKDEVPHPLWRGR